MSIANPLGGIDQLLHGRNALHNWGSEAIPDQVLYRVTGFDPSTRAFLYQVNSRFGSTDAALYRGRVPFRVSVDVAINLSKSIPVQQLDHSLRFGRGWPGAKLTATELKRRYSRSVDDPYLGILRETDSLLLSNDQVRQVQVAQQRLAARTDSIWTGLAEYLGGLGEQYDAKAALVRQENAIADAWFITWSDVRQTLPSVLSPVQLKLLPGIAGALYRSETPYRPGGRTIYGR